MSILDPAVRLIGRLSFRHKMQATALIFGAPLLIALGIIVAGLGARVDAVVNERNALAVQLPALTLLAQTHQYLATAQAWREGAEQLGEAVRARHASTQRAYAALAQAIDERGLQSGTKAARSALDDWPERLAEVAAGDAERVAELHPELRTALRDEVERINERAGLLVDGVTSTSRLLDIMSAQLPELIDTTGQAARLGAVVLVNQRVKSSRRTELTLLRGNFNALVQWSMDGLQKVAREHPDLAGGLDDAASRLNTAYLGVQEAMTTKMLDTTDFDMSPETYLGLTATALEQSLAVAGQLAAAADSLLAARESALRAQRNAVVAALLALLVVVAGAFVAAYISIMRGLNGLSDAVRTMAAGDLSARVEVSTHDEIGLVGKQFNRMVESLAQRTALLREKTNDIQNLLRHMPQGILTIVAGGTIHAEYSDYLETIFETDAIRGRRAIDLLFADAAVGADVVAQIDAAIAACIGEERMNFDFNAHLLIGELTTTLADGRVKHLELGWSPICNDTGIVDKLMVCVRDVSQLRQLEAEAELQKRELQMIGQIIALTPGKFAAFVAGARACLARNAELLAGAGPGDGAETARAQLLAELFRNMHTLKGNARTYGFAYLTDVVHGAEQVYDDLRRSPGAAIDVPRLLADVDAVGRALDAYVTLNDVKLGRRAGLPDGTGEVGVGVDPERLLALADTLAALDPAARAHELAGTLQRASEQLYALASVRLDALLAGVFSALPALARELGKEPPQLQVVDNGLRLRHTIADLLADVAMHLVRNAIDHGIESAAERQRLGKPRAGTLRVELALRGDRLELRFADDGRGLALAAIRRKAIEQGLVGEGETLDDAAIADLVFASGLSTARALSDVSGRGVGMDAVRAFVGRAGGSIELRFTDQRQGADFRAFVTLITLPARYAPGAAVHAAAGASARPEPLRTRVADRVCAPGGQWVAA